MLFEQELTGKASWAQVFCDVAAFTPLVKEVLRRHNLPDKKVTELTPGTNAVFRAGDYVVKLYAPPESGFADGTYGLGEWQAMNAAFSVGVRIPSPVARGVIHDRYDFAYMVMEYMQGQELGDVIDQCSDQEKYDYGQKLRELFERLHQAQCPEFVGRHLGPYFIHGDMTGENILLVDGELALIDFGDALLGPLCYEMPALVIEGMRADPQVIAGFWSEDPRQLWAQVEEGLKIHEFAPQLRERLNALT